MTRNLTRYAWALAAYVVAVILWGAVVRATGSGAGCGGHWPTCDGQLLIIPANTAMWFELAHRASSAVLIALTAILLIWVHRATPRNHLARRAAWVAAAFLAIEALLGAGLVLFGLVGDNDTGLRAAVIAIHLINTLALLSAVVTTAWAASGNPVRRTDTPRLHRVALVFALVGVAAMGATGAVTALGDTLFPPQSLAGALQQDLSPSSHFLLRLRMVHPAIAVSVGVYILLLSGVIGPRYPEARRASTVLSGLVIGQLALGVANMVLLAPIPLQLAHLLLADAIWAALVVITLNVWAERRATQASYERVDAGRADRPVAPASVRATWRDYVALTKPRIISLLLFTTLAAMFVAAGGWPGTWLFLAVAVGGYMSAGAANAINMVIDRDIDSAMGRTSGRPIVTHAVGPAQALVFAAALEMGSFALLWAAANLLTAVLALVGLLYYVVVYTIWLKRRTWHNIVIGGAAGAIPPLVGWSAVTGELSAPAWFLFAIIFLWTPVHFWALSLLIKGDYAAAHIPMLPVVRGDRATVTQIAAYSVLTALASAAPLLQSHVVGTYLPTILALNAVLLLRTFRLYQRPERAEARSLFKFSLAYLALLFLALALDHAVLGPAAWAATVRG